MQNTDVTVIVPVWNGRSLLLKLLERLRAQTYPITELLVMDNGSVDGAAEIAAEQGARVIRMGSNTGFCRAVNRGIEASNTAWLAILNSDLEPAPDWLEHLMRSARECNAWFAAPKLLSATERNRLDGTWDTLCRGACAWRVGNGRRDQPQFSVPRSIRLAPATAALYRAELFRRVGLFDETFESYLEDVDFGLRCALENCHGIYVPEALAYHVGSATMGEWHPETVRRIARNQLLLVAKHYPNRLLLRYWWPIVVAQVLWGLVSIRHGAGWAFVRGKWEGIRSFLGRRPRTLPFERLAAVLTEGEREIHDIQKQAGFDIYWRLYFLLTRGGSI